MLNIALQPVWEGLQDHKWSDAQLVELDQELGKLDFLADYEFSMRSERASMLATIDYLRRTRDFHLLVVDCCEIDDSESVTERVKTTRAASDSRLGVL